MTIVTLFSGAETSFNISFYNVQYLSYGTHVVNVTLLDYSRPGNDQRSCLYFDFAAVNDTGSPTSTTGPASSSETPAPNRPVGLIIFIPDDD
jgi:hypothetical protein